MRSPGPRRTRLAYVSCSSLVATDFSKGYLHVVCRKGHRGWERNRRNKTGLSTPVLMTFGDGDVSLVHYRHLATLLAHAQGPSLSQSLRCYVCSLGWCCPGKTSWTARLVVEFEKEIKVLSLIRRSWWICGGRWEEIRGPVSCPLLTMGNS